MTHVHDAVIVGGGAAGLGAALELAGRDVLLFEREAALGGRLKSSRRGDHWLNLGAHLLPGGASSSRRLLEAVGVATTAVRGSKTAMFYEGRLYDRRVELYPLVLPLRLGERVALARVGITLMHRARAWHAAVRARRDESVGSRRQRLAGFESGRTLADLIGQMPEAVGTIFRSAARRSAAELDEQTAGVGLSIFGALWLGGDSRTVVNIDGGSGALAEAWRHRLGSSVVLDASVVDVAEEGDAVRVTYQGPDGRVAVYASSVVVAVPAPVARQIVSGLPREVEESLATVAYGPFVCLGVVTSQAQPMPWDDLYAVTTPGMPFDMLFNHGSVSRSRSGVGPGGSFMCYAGGAAARALLDAPDEEIRDLFLADLDRVLPGLGDLVTEAVVQKWTYGNVYRTTSTDFEAVARWNERPGGRVRLAGDYFADFGGTVDKAAESGISAARSLLPSMRPDPATSAIA